MYTLNGQPIDINIPQIIDEMQYPVVWLQIEENRQALGIVDDGLPYPAPELDPLKAAKNEQINAWRAAANQTAFTYKGKSISCDPLSRSDIDGVANSIALSGGYPAGFPMAWKAVDNSYIMLPALDDFKAMYAAMTAQGTANFTHAQTLKSQLAAASTPDEIAAIVW